MKKTLNMIAAATFLMTVAPAFAETPAAFVKLGGPNLTLADVFPDVRENTGFVLAPAPGVGRPLVLTASDLDRIAKHFNLNWAPATGHETLRVESSANRITAEDIVAALRPEIEKFYAGQSFDIELTDKNLDIALPKDAQASVAFSRTDLDLATGSFRTTLKTGDKEKQINGRAFLMASVPVLKRPLRSGDVIGLEDVAYVDVRANSVANGSILNVEHLIGMTPKRMLSAMRPVAGNDVTAPLSLKKGDLVTMVLSTGSMMLTGQGRALDGGAVGDVVRVINTSSNRVIEGVITAPQTVTIKAST